MPVGFVMRLFFGSLSWGVRLGKKKTVSNRVSDDGFCTRVKCMNADQNYRKFRIIIKNIIWKNVLQYIWAKIKSTITSKEFEYTQTKTEPSQAKNYTAFRA